MWGRQSYRFSDLDFEANLGRHRHRLANRYADIAPCTTM